MHETRADIRLEDYISFLPQLQPQSCPAATEVGTQVRGPTTGRCSRGRHSGEDRGSESCQAGEQPHHSPVGGDTAGMSGGPVERPVCVVGLASDGYVSTEESNRGRTL